MAGPATAMKRGVGLLAYGARARIRAPCPATAQQPGVCRADRGGRRWCDAAWGVRLHVPSVGEEWEEVEMSATGLAAFDSTVQTTNI